MEETEEKDRSVDGATATAIEGPSCDWSPACTSALAVRPQYFRYTCSQLNVQTMVAALPGPVLQSGWKFTQGRVVGE